MNEYMDDSDVMIADANPTKAGEKFDTPHDPTQPPMPQFPEYLPGNDLAMIWDVTGMKLHDKTNQVIKSAEFKNSPHTSFPWCCRFSRVLPHNEAPPPPFENVPFVGHFSGTEFHPYGNIFKAQKYLAADARQPKWSTIPDLRHVSTPKLFAGIMAQMPNLLIQSKYHIDLREDFAGEDDPLLNAQGPWITSVPMMKDFLQSCEGLAEPFNARDCNTRNKINWRCSIEMVAIQFLGNSSFVSKIFPKAQYEFPSDELEQFGDHHLTHFHSGLVENEDPAVAAQRRKMRVRLRQKPKLGHYIAYKRAHNLIKPHIYQLCRGGIGSDAAFVRNLIPDDDISFTSLPCLSHDRVFKSVANKIFKEGVWHDFPSWHKNNREGIFVVEFFFWWGLGGASYVANLTLEKRLAWKSSVLRGDSAKDLGWLVTSTKMDEVGYPVDFPEGKSAPIVLSIHEMSDKAMKTLKDDGKKSLQKAHDLILKCRKNMQGNYIIGQPLWTPSD